MPRPLSMTVEQFDIVIWHAALGMLRINYGYKRPNIEIKTRALKGALEDIKTQLLLEEVL